jgi:two-component system cell cycle response regulator
MRVLIAEDDNLSRRVLETALRNWNYEVISVADGMEALEALQREDPPRLAVLDWMMPGKDGPEVCREIRARPSERYIYILLLTSRNDKADVAEGLQAGADDYVTKPFAAAELRARLLAGSRIIELQEQLLEAQEKLRHQANHDALTGLLNRSAILERLNVELSRARRQKAPLSVVMSDVDRFKNINDTHGHQVGDAVLGEMAQRMSVAVRVYDAVGRYGGEEFLTVLPGCDGPTALALSERLLQQVRRPCEIKNLPDLLVTCSFGIATTLDGSADADCIVRAADDALYRAKAAGRDRIEVAP